MWFQQLVWQEKRYLIEHYASARAINGVPACTLRGTKAMKWISPMVRWSTSAIDGCVEQPCSWLRT